MAEHADNISMWAADADAVRQNIARIQERLKDAEVTGAAGSGAVALRMSAHGELRDIRIDPAATGDVATLRRHILAAHAQAWAGARQLNQELMGPLNELVSRYTQRQA
jgi:DNA-binding protein YbaB